MLHSVAGLKVGPGLLNTFGSCGILTGSSLGLGPEGIIVPDQTVGASNPSQWNRVGGSNSNSS